MFQWIERIYRYLNRFNKSKTVYCMNADCGCRQSLQHDLGVVKKVLYSEAYDTKPRTKIPQYSDNAITTAEVLLVAGMADVTLSSGHVEDEDNKIDVMVSDPIVEQSSPLSNA